MSQLFRLLLLAPSVLASMLSLTMVAKPVHAETETWVPVSKDLSCVRTFTREPKKLVCKRLNAGTTAEKQVIDLTKVREENNYVDERLPNGEFPDTFELSDEESEAAVALFGCDCPVCVRSLRQLRSMTSA